MDISLIRVGEVNMFKSIEKQLEDLQNLQADLSEKPDDFEQFWQEKKQQIAKYQPKVTINWVDYPIPTIQVGEITLVSWDDTPINGLIVKPIELKEGPIICSYHGLTGHKGFPVDYLKWTSLGLTVISFDVRGQGTSPDYATYTNGARSQAWILKGILDPEEHYYTNIYQDIMTQMNWVMNQSIVIPTKIGVVGSSQGGAQSAAAAGLMNEVVDFALIDCPFMTYVGQAMQQATDGSYLAVKDYFKLNDAAFEDAHLIERTFSYVDTINFADKIICPVLMATGLLDGVTPPISAYALHNTIASKDKQIDCYPRHLHEVVPDHEIKKLEFVAKHSKKR